MPHDETKAAGKSQSSRPKTWKIALAAIRAVGRRWLAAGLLVVGCLLGCVHCRAQAALLMEEPYGFFGAVNPTGHNAVYFERICAATPVKLRRCRPGELGAVIARYQGMGGYDWVAIPLVPYLYATENLSDVPRRVDRESVWHLRDRYHEEHLLALGAKVPRGSLLRGGWAELIGVSYERTIYAYRFETTEAQDDALIARLNTAPNRSHFHMLFNNCADFARVVMNGYFPHTFRRSLFPDAGMTTPKQTVYKLVRYARKHPAIHLTVFRIEQVPGYRRHSGSNKSISESLATTGYAVPIAVLNPYLAGGIFVDYAIRGRFHLIPKNPETLRAANLTELIAHPPAVQEAERVAAQAQVPLDDGEEAAKPAAATVNAALTEGGEAHE